MISREMGRRIKQQRSALGLAQRALCEKAEVSRAVLSKLESGRGEPVQTDVLDRLLAALGADSQPVTAGWQGSRMEERLRQRLHEQQLRERHLRLAIELCANPKEARSSIRRALEQVDLWEQRKSCSPRYIERWRQALSGNARGVAIAMSSFGEWENAMFQNSPWSFVWS
jgi:transcriptional regulator with XRE-family HTH domain